MRATSKRFTGAFLLGFLIPTLAHAQSSFLGVTSSFLKDRAIQRELNLRPQQIEQALALADDTEIRMNEASQALRESGRRPDAAEAFRRKCREIGRGYEKSLAAALEPDQMKRLREINYQRLGIHAFRDAGLREDLKLTAEQVAKFEELARAKSERNRQELRRRREGKAAADRATVIEEARRRAIEEAESIQGVLNPDQKKAWAEKVGKPFDETALP
jgi:hypothetical protein